MKKLKYYAIYNCISKRFVQIIYYENDKLHCNNFTENIMEVANSDKKYVSKICKQLNKEYAIGIYEVIEIIRKV